MQKSERLRDEHRKALNRLEHAKAQREAGYKMIVRSDAKIKKAEGDVARIARRLKATIETELATAREPKPATVQAPEPAPVSPPNEATEPADDMPPFLKRESNRLAALPDPRTKEKKAERRAVEKEVREAELTGKRRKMPLSGKDALAALRAS